MIFHATLRRTLRGLFAAVDHIVDSYCMSVSACGAHCLLPLHEFVYTIVHSYCNILNATIMLSLCVWSLFVYVSVAVYLSVRLSVCLSVCLGICSCCECPCACIILSLTSICLIALNGLLICLACG